MEKVKGNGSSQWGIIHEEFVKYEKPAYCFRRHEITRRAYETMTNSDTLRWWKARGITREYTELGYVVTGHSRRRWGDNLKVLDRWHIVKVGTEYEPIDKSMDEV